MTPSRYDEVHPMPPSRGRNPDGAGGCTRIHFLGVRESVSFKTRHGGLGDFGWIGHGYWASPASQGTSGIGATASTA